MSLSFEDRKIKPAFRLWFEVGEKYVFGEGTYTLLDAIRTEKSISAAARAIDMSYRHAWDLIKEVEEHLGEAVIRTQKGGKHGGKSELTDAGFWLLKSYSELRKVMTKICKLG